jgi:hypothetical protein
MDNCVYCKNKIYYKEAEMRYYELRLPDGNYVMSNENFIRNFMIRLGTPDMEIPWLLNQPLFTVGDYTIKNVGWDAA